MRVLIVSDTHRRDENLEFVLRSIGDIDCLIHLGDAEGSEVFIREIANCPVHIILGNNDYFSELPREEELQIGKYKILLTHGNYYYVGSGTYYLKEEGRARDFDIVLYGHTHVPLVEIEDDIIVANPGSLSYPRQKNRKPSYAIMDIDDNGDAHFEIQYLDV